MEQTTLDKEQQIFLKLFSESPFHKRFYLTGGTALAEFYLHHRKSGDLDFFSESEVDSQGIRTFIEEVIFPKIRGIKIMPAHKYDRWIFEIILPKEKCLKVEFTRYPYPRLGTRKIKQGILIDSLPDIAANKIAAMTERFEPKDYVDIYFIVASKRLSLRKIIKLAEIKFKFDLEPAIIGPTLMRAKDLPVMPKLLKPVAREEIRNFFFSAARRMGRGLLL